jgi:hypothetical protein
MIGVLQAGETPQASDTQDALLLLNMMMDSWSTERLTVFQIKNELFDVVVNQTDYLIGPGAQWDTTRPIITQNASAFIRAVTGVTTIPVDYPMTYYPNDQFQSIVQKFVTTSYPNAWTCDHAMPISKIRLYPKPILATQFGLSQSCPLQKFNNLIDIIELPPGYELAICYNLAVHLCPEYGVILDPVIAAKAVESLYNVKRINSEYVPVGADPALLLAPTYSIYAG